jgi:hypothetical protein
MDVLASAAFQRHIRFLLHLFAARGGMAGGRLAPAARPSEVERSAVATAVCRLRLSEQPLGSPACGAVHYRYGVGSGSGKRSFRSSTVGSVPARCGTQRSGFWVAHMDGVAPSVRCNQVGHRAERLPPDRVSALRLVRGHAGAESDPQDSANRRCHHQRSYAARGRDPAACRATVGGHPRFRTHSRGGICAADQASGGIMSRRCALGRGRCASRAVAAGTGTACQRREIPQVDCRRGGLCRVAPAPALAKGLKIKGLTQAEMAVYGSETR